MLEIKYKYFSDKTLMMWKLCYAFFEMSEIISSTTQQADYLMVSDFDAVFEAMIDALLSDKDITQNDRYHLKTQLDNKQVDHIYRYEGLINEGHKIYYIGDSKYYKLGSEVQPYSVYKQYTYARNVIQRNLDLFFEGKEDGKDYLIYRDPDTEGYSITPNFFIRGRMNCGYDYNSSGLEFKGDEKPLIHFEDRLFDRDTLLLQHYDINFLFVVSLYAANNAFAKSVFKEKTRKEFREKVIRYVSDHYALYSLTRKSQSADMPTLIDKYFRRIIGKTFRPYDDAEILYLGSEIGGVHVAEDEQLILDLSADFDVRDYKLGTDPRSYIQKTTDIVASATQSPAALSRKFRFEDFSEDVFVVGCYRSQKKQEDWIFANKLYNLRYYSVRPGGVMHINEAASARFLVLYDIADTDFRSSRLFLLGGKSRKTADTLKKMGYPNPSGQYLVSEIVAELQFEPFDLGKIMKYARIEELERRRRLKESTDDFEKDWMGSPVFKTGAQLAEILNK